MAYVHNFVEKKRIIKWVIAFYIKKRCIIAAN